MSDSNEHVGFSFQLSETPPPAETRPLTPLGDLDLDLGEFNDASPAEAKQESTTPTPVSDAAPIASMDDLETPLVSVPDIIAVARRRDEVPRTATPALIPEPEPLPEPEPEPEPVAAEPVAAEPIGDAQRAPLSTPRIKKIQFPARSKKRPTAAPSRPKTHFSKSISDDSPRGRLESDAEMQGSATDVTSSNPLPPANDLVAPEDLPEPGAPVLSSGPQELAEQNGSEWGSDTPSAQEIWRRARKTWHTTSRHAAKLSVQGWKATGRLATTVNDRVRDSLRKAAEERHLAEERRRATVHEGEGPEVDGGATKAPPTPPNRAGKLILGLAKSTGKKLAAPLSAAAAAAIVYFAGTHLLGTDGTVALSKAVEGPAVPELGTLKSQDRPPKKEADSGEEKTDPASAKKAEKKPSGPVPMQTEVTDMPEGLSWPGKGLIEVVTSEEELIYVDGVFTGRGPLRRIPVSPGKHEISIRTEEGERSGTVEVTANRNTRAVFKIQ